MIGFGFWNYNLFAFLPFFFLPLNFPTFLSFLSYHSVVPFFIDCYWLLTCICVQYILCIHVYVYTYVFVNITSWVCIISFAYGFTVENQRVCSSMDKNTSTAPTFNQSPIIIWIVLRRLHWLFPHLVLHVHRCHPSSSHIWVSMLVKNYRCIFWH